MPRVTIVDVAARAGVNVSTASRALNPAMRHRISERMVSKIERIAGQLGYKANPLASSLRTQRTGTIGLVVPNLSDPLFAPIIASVQERVARNDYITLVASSDYDPKKLLSIIETMGHHSVAGLVVASFELADPAAERCVALGIPTVAVLRDPHHPQLSSIAMDDVGGVETLVEHVLALGHRTITYVTAPLAASTARNRLAGFQAGMRSERAAGCRFDVVEAEAYDVDGGSRVMRRLLADKTEATAILCFNDLLAVGALVALREAGIDCPAQMSVSGVNDLPFMGLLSPSLTSLRNDGRGLGAEGADLLMTLIGDSDHPVTQLLLPSPLLVRGSTGPAPPGTGRPEANARTRRQKRPPGSD